MQNFNLFLTNLGGLNDVLLFDFEVTRPKKDSVESVKYIFFECFTCTYNFRAFFNGSGSRLRKKVRSGQQKDPDPKY